MKTKYVCQALEILNYNFGHGKNSLSTVLALLMMLAFLIDQIQQKACSLFKAVLIKLVRKKYLWEKMRGLFYEFEFNSMQNLFEAMLYGFKNKRLEIAYQENSA